MDYWIKRNQHQKYYLGIIISFILITVHIVGDMLPNRQYLDGHSLIHLPATMWIGLDNGGSFSSLFYLLLPLTAALGSNLIIFEDKKTGFLKRYVQKKGRLNYCYFAFGLSFLSGFLISFFPLILDFIVAFCLFPNIKPDNLINYNLGITSHSMYFSQFYFSNPYFFIFGYIIAASLFSALYACISAVISLYSETIYSAIIGTFLGVLGITTLSFVFPDHISSLIELLMPIGNSNVPSLIWISFMWLGVGLLSFYLFVRGVRKNVVI